jgi:uncharacterized protein
VNKLKQISIYPIKSCSGINLEHAKVEDRGFPFDRRWMLIEENGDFVSQRKSPTLSLFKISVGTDNLRITYPGLKPHSFPLDSKSNSQIKAHIWKDSVRSHLVSAISDQWFSEALDRKVRLVYMDDTVIRPLEKEQLPGDQSFEVSFADGYPYLLTNQASLDDLNHRLDVPIRMDRFRANLVVSGAEAFAEDHWKRIRIGEVEFMVVKPCARCQVTTIDQKTGKSSKEPLKTLASYRKQDDQVMFGMNLVALNSGRIKVDSPVRILEENSGPTHH